MQKADADNAEMLSVDALQQIADSKAGAEGQQQHLWKQQAVEDVNMREADGEEEEGSPSAGPPTGCLSLSCGKQQQLMPGLADQKVLAISTRLLSAALLTDFAVFDQFWECA